MVNTKSVEIGAQRPEVLVVTYGGWLGVSRLPRTLSCGGCRVSTLSVDTSFFRGSRYVDEILAVERHAPEGLMGALRELLLRRPNFYQWILFADEMALADAWPYRHQSWLRPWLPISAQADPSRGLATARLKTVFVRAAPAAAIPIPDSRVAATLEQASQAARELGYPLVLKADYSYGGQGVRLVCEAQELATAYHEISKDQPVVVQSFVAGPVGSTCVLFDHGRALAWSSSYTWASSSAFAPSSARHFMVHPQMEAIIEKIGRLTTFHGFCGIDWIHRADDDSLCVLEFNPRPTPTIHLGIRCGVDFPRAVRAMLGGADAAPVQRPQLPPPDQRIVYMFPQHLEHCLFDNGLSGITRWIPGVAPNDVPWDEPRLLLRQWPRPRLSRRTRKRLKALLISGQSLLAKQHYQLKNNRSGA